MGVHGLWRLIEPSGKPVPIETLENKVLGVDVSIWLHQAIKGFQDSKGAPVPNAHLLGIYHRVCKLLYFKVKPVFIFDGGVPALKKQTIAKRHQQKSRNISEAERLQKQLLSTLLKHTAISKVLSEKTKALALAPKKTSKNENMYALPPSEFDSTISSSEDEDSDYTSSTTDSSPNKHWDLHTIDMSSVHFKSLPVDVRHEILTELKETRKQNSWGKLHELPRQSDDFSVYQMKRLLKRQAVQSALEDAEKEMGGHSLSMAELESILKDHGVATTNDVGKRIASDENTRYLLIKDVKQAMEIARKEEQLKLESQQTEDTEKVRDQDNIEETKTEGKTKADLEYEDDLQKAIALSLQEEPSTSKTEKVTDDNGSGNKLEFSFLENFRDEDFQSDSSEEIEEVSTKKTFSSAQHYMMEYSGLTPNEIAKILHDKNKQPLKRSKRKKIVVKTTMVDTVELMSDSDESDEFVEVSLKEQKNDISVSSNIRVQCTNETSYCIEISKGNKTEMTSSDTKFNESTEKSIINSSNEVSKHEDVEITSTREDSDVFGDDTKNNNAINNDAIDIPARNVSIINTESTGKYAIKSNEVLTTEQSDALKDDSKNNSVIIHDTTDVKAENVSVINTEKYAVKSKEVSTTEELDAEDDTKNNIIIKDDIPAENIANEKIEENLAVEIMSDSDSDSSVEFVEVSVNKRTDNLMEIVIDPNESVKDDLFDDIFHEKEESQNKESTVIQPQSKLDKDLHSNRSTDKSTVVEETNSSSGKQISETKKSLEVIKEDELLVIQNMEESREEVATSSKSENIAVIKNSMAVNLKNLKASNLDKPIQNNEIQKEMRKIERQKLNVEEMRKLKNDLENEKIDLMIEKSTKERMASNITDQMSQEAQDLLELFGVPYIVAPMEAEAQCAFLDEIELTDGTITDDSDIWLFGGRTVYKNFFNQSKYVMEFKAEDIKHNFKLTREQMVLFALLVGSDYTTGLQGIGPVTALEILAAFPPSIAKEISLSHAQLLSGLKEFRTWFNRGKTAGPGRSALKNKLNNVSFTDNFPSVQVVQAYLEPTVETSREKFSWAKPNFIGLKEFAREKFGWSTKKAEEILKPVIKKVEETRIQKTIKDFFKTVHKVESHEAEKKMSKRVKTAIDRIGKTPDELIAEEMEALSKEKQKKARKKKIIETDQKAEDKDVQTKPTRKRTKQKENVSESSKSAVANSEDNAGDELITEEMEALSKEKQKGTRRKKNIETDQKTEDKDVQTKPTRKRTKQKKNEGSSESSKVAVANGKDNAGDTLTKQMVAPKPKRPRNKNDKAIENTSTADKIPTTVKDSEENQTIETVDEDTNSLETYENIAMELKKRRQRKIDQSNQDDVHKKKQYRPPPKKVPPTDSIPKVLEDDEEVQLLKATTSRSLKRVEEIDQEVKNELSQDVKKKRLPDFHKKEVIHQKLRDKSDVLRNKLKAIEVFRKSKKGPGYVKKQNRKIRLPREDAALSENSSDE